ncbi:MAG: Fic family protein [Cryomorphaceae bacterium]
MEKTQQSNLDITLWMMWFLNCLKNSLRSTNAFLKRVLAKAEFWNRHSKTILNKRQKEMLNRLWDGFEGKLTSLKMAKMVKCSKDSAIRDINDLTVKGALQKEAAGGRSTNYELVKLVGN